jgi:hypothetical protein
MSTHTFHPDTHRYGLVDGCPRCAEHAAHPASSLDDENLATLRERAVKGLPPRSDAEAVAMANLTGRSL